MYIKILYLIKMASRAGLGHNEIHVAETNVQTSCFDVRTRLYEIWFDAAEMDMTPLY